MKVNIEVDIKSIIDGRRMSLREFSRSIDHSFETVRKMYHGKTTRYPKHMLEKIMEVYKIPLDELIIVTYTKGDDANA